MKFSKDFITTLIILVCSMAVCTVISCCPPRTSGLVFLKANQIHESVRRAYAASFSVLNEKGVAIGGTTILRWEPGKPILAITAHHVVRERPEYFYIGLDHVDANGLHKAILAKLMTIKKENMLKDLALLEGVKKETTYGPTVQIGLPAKIRDNVCVIGNPLGLQRNVSCGVISAISYMKGGLKIYRTDSAIFFGNSGGGLFKDNKLIGVVQAIYMVSTGMGGLLIVPGSGIAAHTDEIISFLEMN